MSRAAYFRQYYQANRHRQLERRRKWYADNREHALKVQADYKRRNAQAMKLSKHLGIRIAQARKLIAGENHDPHQGHAG